MKGVLLFNKKLVTLLSMLKAYKYRLYPTIPQKVELAHHFGCTRLVYNLGLEAKSWAYKDSRTHLSYSDLSSQLTDMKNGFDFFSNVNSQALQSSLRHLDTSYKNFFTSRKKNGKEYTKKALRKKRLNPEYFLTVKDEKGFPKFKSKFDKQSFSCPQNVNINEEIDLLYIPKFREGIKMELHRKFKGEIKTVTISKTPTGKYFASVLVDSKKELPKKKKVKEKTTVGIDLGINHFAILSDGEKIDNERFLKASLDRLAYLQKELRRKEKGSNRRNLARLKVAKQHEKIANKRTDFLHKLSDEITNRFDTICMENLNVKGMSSKAKPKQDEDGKYLPNGQSKKKGLNRSIADVGWSKFVLMLEYKCEWKGKNFVKIGRFFPSSKMCCKCKNVNKDLTLKDRRWICPKCGENHDRDICGAINIKNEGLKILRRTERACQDTEAAGYRTDEVSI